MENKQINFQFYDSIDNQLFLELMESQYKKDYTLYSNPSEKINEILNEKCEIFEDEISYLSARYSSLRAMIKDNDEENIYSLKKKKFKSK